MASTFKRIICGIACGMWLSSASAIEADICAGGVVHGSGWAFLVASPEGWCMTLNSGLPVNAAFIQVESESKQKHTTTPPTFMYLTLSSKDSNVPDLSSLITYDEEDFIQSSPGLKITTMPPLNTGDKRPTEVRQFQGGEGGRCETVAYKDSGAIMYKIVITAPDCEQLEINRNAFEQLVGSIVDIDGGVTFQENDQK